ncbi:DNA-binding response OmpR family regulator [Salana multivorans]|uniref:DNA-binding response OmpR family regulator n=1 Tax=Salana multivorans TaxID=120377 RepID=A0A3N2DAB5_9MICO|nr:response regulator transcription factor [Salana multivorans]MBN8881462.1 response regulator transcription factor [Salana multivorans]OJX96903.1 MAG: DNA-binding response regulator [Micrococcales bacterium 73-15]ROR96729.1 DNA-binding response OmpR family regulator [Salana multivorans]
MTARVLLVDDEEAIRASLAPFLTRAGLEVHTASDGEEALAAVARLRPELVVCDVLMPNLDGRSVVRRLREAGDWTPVILLTQVGESYERSAALEEGADDYLNKPFDPAELLARIRAVLRRAVPGVPSLPAATVVASGELRLDRAARRVFVGDREVDLTPRASLLLDYLMTHPDELHTREHLLATLWGFGAVVASRAVDHRVAEIRRVLGDDAAAPRWIETVPAGGYRFCAPVGVVR